MNTCQLFDTLDDINDHDGNFKLTDFVNRLFGGIINNKNAYGYMFTGKYSVSAEPEDRWGKTHVVIGTERVFARVSPKGSAGKPLGIFEERVIKILCTENPAEITDGELTTFVFNCYRDQKQAETLINKRYDMRHTTACYGIAATLIHIPEHHGVCVEMEPRWYSGKEEFHAVFPAYEVVGCEDNTCFVSYSTSIYTIAASLAGILNWGDVPNRPIISFCKEEKHRGLQVNHQTDLAKSLQRIDPNKFIIPNERAAQRISAALQISEANSFVGFLQLMCDPHHSGVLPDDLTRPNRIPMLMVASIAIASEPQRYGIANGTRNDQYAVGKLREMFRDYTTSVIQKVDGKKCYYSIDVLIEYANEMVESELRHIDASMFPKEVRIARIHEIQHIRQDTMHAFYRMGVGLAQEVFTPKDKAYYKTLYSDSGFASGMYDPIARADVERCNSAGLRSTHSAHRIENPSTHELRVNKLIGIMLEVDQFLRLGLINGVQMLEPGAAPRPTLLPKLDAQVEEAVNEETDKLIEEIKADLCKKGGKKKVRKHKKAQASASDATTKTSDTAKAPTLFGKKNLINGMNPHAMEIASSFLSKALRIGIPHALATLDYTAFTASITSTSRCSSCTKNMTCIESMAFQASFSKCPRCYGRRCFDCATKIIDSGPSSEPPTCLSCKELENIEEAKDLLRATLGIE